MGTRSTFTGKIRSHGGSHRRETTPGVIPVSIVVTGAHPAASSTAVRVGTSATAGPEFVLPKGAIPYEIRILDPAGGGTSPTFSLGSAVDPDGFLLNSPADATKGTTLDLAGDLTITSGLTADTTVAIVNGGTGSAGSGNVTMLFTYTFADDGVVQD